MNKHIYRIFATRKDGTHLDKIVRCNNKREPMKMFIDEIDLEHCVYATPIQPRAVGGSDC